ncbi:MAG: glycosyltransferase family 1 protein [Verrucomicrobiota bacterium]
MRVLLVANYPPDRQQSMWRLARLFSNALPQFGVRCEIIQPSPVFGGRLPSNRGLGKWLGYLDKYLLFPKSLARAAGRWMSGPPQDALIHILDHSNAVYTRVLQPWPHLVTCLDCLAIRSAQNEFPENPTRWTGKQLQQAILGGLNRACHIAAASLATARDVGRLCTLPPQRLSTIHLALNYGYAPMGESEAARHIKALLSRASFSATKLVEPFLLHVSGNQWYKNRPGLLRMYLLLVQQQPTVPRLILVGEPLPNVLRRFIAEHGLSDHVTVLTDCGDEELRALYTRAELVLFPSLAEGFGWPILEAQACGGRVLTSDVEPMPEVAGASAFFVNPRDDRAAAEVLGQAIQEPAASRRARIAEGLQNVQRFSLDNMMTQYVQLYRNLIKQ